MAGCAFHVDPADKEIQRSRESKYDCRVRGRDFGLNIGEASGGEKDADALANLIPA